GGGAPAGTFSTMDIGQLAATLPANVERMAAARQAVGDEIPWYPYDILGNVVHLNVLLRDWARDLDALAAGLPVADIGGADGDLAFSLEHECGWSVDMMDNSATNNNGLRGVRALAQQLGSEVRTFDIDLDTQFRLPSERYGLVFLLGILYHLQNPFYVLRELGRRCDHVLLSTRVARLAGSGPTVIADLPVAYLVGPSETNNDPTNYWMFSVTGLERLVTRAGWTVIDQISFGDLQASDPSSADHDERRFMLLRSSRLTPARTIPPREPSVPAPALPVAEPASGGPPGPAGAEGFVQSVRPAAERVTRLARRSARLARRWWSQRARNGARG
ncbi:MAG: methyltransferase domain-containing protein, partial [Solirubrobacteraceae bacterium]